MPLQEFNSDCTVRVGAQAVITLPATNLRVVCYPAVGEVASVVELVTKERYVRPFSEWHLDIELSWENLSLERYDALVLFVEQMVAALGTTNRIKFSPDPVWPISALEAERTVDVIPDLEKETINAIYLDRVRSRETALRLTTRLPLPGIPVWIKGGGL
jgi:hypothetical protein